MLTAQSTLQNSDVSFGFTVGSQLPLVHTAIGRSMLAAGDPEWAGHLICTLAFEQYTNETSMQRDEIAKRVDESRQPGFAVVSSEFETMVTGLALPVGGPDYLKATVGISLPGQSVRDERRRLHIIRQLQEVAQELARTR